MQAKDWQALKSGSDVRGTALEGVEGEHVDLTDEAVSGIMKAFLYRLSDKLGKKKLTVAVGHDSRLSAKRISDCAIAAIEESGCDALFTGLSSTPSMFMLLQDHSLGADASVMITASHLPFNKNGLKFFTAEGGLEGKTFPRSLPSRRKERLSLPPKKARIGTSTTSTNMPRDSCGSSAKRQGKIRRLRAKRSSWTRATARADFMWTRC